MTHFSKIKKIIVGALMSVSLVLVGVGLTACGDEETKNEVPPLFGFDVGETITVEQYALVYPTNVHVTDAEGTMYDVVVSVCDSKGNQIATDEGNKFNAYDANGYTITYSIETWDFTISKTVKVKVNKMAEDLDFEIECNTLVAVGDTVSVGIVGNASNPKYTLSVVNKQTGNACVVSTTDGLTFQPTEIGVHTLQLTVQADEGTATKKMEVYVRAPLQEGEVEVFDEDWLTIREFSPRHVGMESTWTAATTAETGIKDADGNDGTFAVLETDADYTHIYFNARESRAYYRDLAMKGYTHVRFRVYVDSPTGRGKLFSWEHNSTNSWRTSLGSAPNGAWKEFYIPLMAGVAGTSDKKPGFVEAYDYYLSTWILLLDNSASNWNPNGKDVDKDGNPLKFKIYFDDVVAVRKTYETSINTTVDKDAYNLSELLSRAWGTNIQDYTYSITKHTQYSTVKNTLVDEQTLTSSMVDLSNLMGNDSAYGSYEVSYFIKNANSQDPYQRVWIDVLDPNNKAYAHPDLHNFAAARGMIWRYKDASANVKANTDGTITYTTQGLWGAGLQIPPAYDVEYYKALQQEGYTALTFNVKLDVEYNQDATQSQKDSPYMVCTLAQGNNGVMYQNGETHTLSVSIDKIITYYNKLKNVALLPEDQDWFAEYVLFYVQYNNKEYSYNHSKLTFTISALQMVK